MPRQKLNFNEKEIANYARLGCSNREIADMLGCDEGTIRKRFSALLAKARGWRKAKLRELQWKAAEAGNPTMLIWLGKNDLGQSDEPGGAGVSGPGEVGFIFAMQPGQKIEVQRKNDGQADRDQGSDHHGEPNAPA